MKVYKLNIILISLVCFCFSLPSFLIYFSQLKCDDCIVFTQNTILFEEKFWIYFLEFKRQLTVGVFSWPSLNSGFNEMIYVERLLPRILYIFLPDHKYYFLYDGFIIITISFISIKILLRILTKYKISLLPLLLGLTFASIYFVRIIFLEEAIPEMWFSRNPVAILSLLFSTAIIFYKSQNKNKELIVKLLSLFLLQFTHTYSFMLVFGFYVINLIIESINLKRINIYEFVSLFIIFLIFITIFLHLQSIDEFEEFKKYYGAVKDNSINLNELSKLLVLFSLTILFYRNEMSKKVRILIISAFLLTNAQIVSGILLRDIHYRIYIIEWFLSIIIIAELYKLIVKRLYFSKTKLINHLAVLPFLIYIFLYTIYFEYEYKFSENNTCNFQKNMIQDILSYDSTESLNCNLFIWDSPNYKSNLEMYMNCDGKNCDSWRDATIHLRTEN